MILGSSYIPIIPLLQGGGPPKFYVSLGRYKPGLVPTGLGLEEICAADRFGRKYMGRCKMSSMQSRTTRDPATLYRV